MIYLITGNYKTFQLVEFTPDYKLTYFAPINEVLNARASNSTTSNVKNIEERISELNRIHKTKSFTYFEAPDRESFYTLHKELFL